MNCQFARLRTLKPRRFLVLLNRGRALWEMGLGRERARRALLRLRHGRPVRRPSRPPSLLVFGRCKSDKVYGDG